MAFIRVSFDEACERLERSFRSVAVPADGARTLGSILATNSLEGVLSHGLHFFPLIWHGLCAGTIVADATPERAAAFGAWEQWDGRHGPGPLNALHVTERAMELAREHGVGVVGLRHTNHWTRPGYYGHHAARRGHGLVCWANTPAVMPAWGSRAPRLGNNPIVFALPNGECPIVHDMALSQFSMGRLRTTQLAGEILPVPGGYDEAGELSTDPAAVARSGRSLPVGYWKGSGLALLLDLFAANLAAGQTTLDRTEQPEVDDVSQVFIAVDFAGRADASAMQATATRVLDDLRATFEPAEDGPAATFRYPGQGVAERRAEHEAGGVPVDERVWQKIVETSDAAG